ncbi:MAG: SGNH/GDSL hydrolase family protein [Clostridia bacterium]|nr:SGNH/GDSL hydrolase family protein [Clostridia bacterium]MEE1116185.1 SGNH/GDSL hydrolase family protein [Clostridia bacterium]
MKFSFENNDRIVFAGDSITDSNSTNPVGEGLFGNLGNGYVRLIEAMLFAYYPEINIRITNSGISGNTIRDLKGRWQRDVLDLEPQWVNILIGANDVWRQMDMPAFPHACVLPDEYEKTLEEMLISLQGKVKGVTLMLPYYMENNLSDKMRAEIEKYDDICRHLGEKYGCIIIDLQHMFDEYLNYHHSSFLAWDRIHPNMTACVLIAREYLKAVGFDFDHKPL